WGAAADVVGERVAPRQPASTDPRPSLGGPVPAGKASDQPLARELACGELVRPSGAVSRVGQYHPAERGDPSGAEQRECPPPPEGELPGQASHPTRDWPSGREPSLMFRP